MNRKISIIIILFVFVSFSFADTNGIWTYPEDIKAGVFGADEITVGENYTFDNIVYFNKNIFVDSLVSNTNPSYILNLSGVSNINRIVADMYFSPGTNAYYLNPKGTSKLKNLEVETSLKYKGQDLDSRYIKSSFRYHDLFESSGNPLPNITVSGGMDKWPDYIICNLLASNRTYLFKLKSYFGISNNHIVNNTIVYHHSNYFDISFNGNGSINSFSASTLCGSSSGLNIVQICNEGRCS